MRIKSLCFSFIMGVLLMASCSRNIVSLTYTNAKDEVPHLGNLIFRFNQSLVTDSMLNNWDSTEYISFTPAIPGRFRWESPDQLVFSPVQPLLPATTYTATIKNTVLKFSKFNEIKQAGNILFHTPDITLDNAQVTWVGESGISASPQVDLFFNYRVKPEELKGKLKLEVDGKVMDYTLITASPDNKISLRVGGLKPEDKDYTTRLSIEKGFKPENGNNGTAEPITTSLVIPSPFVLTIQNVESEHDGTEGAVNIVTSQQLTPENIKSYITFNPVINFTTEINENGITLRSDKFDVDKSYVVSISKGLRGKIGGILKEDYDASVAFGELEASISFANNKAVYLSKKGGKKIEVNITNVSKVKLVISKIYENNLLLSQHNGYYPKETNRSTSGYENDEYSYGSYEDYNAGITLGDVIYEKEIDTRSLPKSGSARVLNLAQFEDRLPELNGVYHVLIRSADDYWVRDSRYISLSDLGLIIKEGADKIFVFTNSIKTALPVNGVNISIYAANNQLIGVSATNSEGVAEIAYSKKDFAGFKPALVIAKTADDFNYLPFNNTRVNTSRFEVGGKRTNPSGLDAFVYAERDIYRPGEKVNFSVIIRDRQWKTPGDIPLKLKFLMPNGKELKSIRKNLNEEGSIEGSVAIAASAITGSYTLEVYTSTDILLAAKNFSVEEFVPDRIKVSTKLDKLTLRPGESAALNINAMNFFGPPAANRNYETEIQIKQKSFTPVTFSNYNFTLANQNNFFDKQIREGKTDSEGNILENYKVPDNYANMGVLQASFYTTVFDETGRPVSRVSSADIFTQDVFYGVRYDWNYYYPLNQPVKIEVVSVNKEGNAASSKARVEVIKHEYRTVLAKSGSYFRYNSQKEDKLMIENQITVGSPTVYSYIPRSPGDYEFRIYRPGSNNYVSKNFYSYGSWGGNNNSFEVNNEGSIDISLDKKSYQSGETVKALFKTPFSGKMLVTMETDHVLSYRYIDITNRSASLDLKLSGEHVPNVYITATLIKPHEVSEIPLTVAHGFQNVTVEEKSRKMPVEIIAKKSVRSRTHQSVKVKAEPGSYISLSVVDNGVLQVSNFKTPDPYNYFYQKKALQVMAYDLYPLLFAEARSRQSSTGGDGELSMEKRVNPMPAKRIKVVSYWSGIKKANGRGEAEFEFDIPQFSGEVRLMAVSYKGQSFGAAENTMTVADPLVISTALPRFLSPGDSVIVPVTLSNTTDKAANIAATISVHGAVKIVGNNSQSMLVNAKSEGKASFNLVATNAIGVGSIKILVNAMGEKFEEVTEISVRPPSTLQKITGSGAIAGGNSQKISIDLDNFIPGSTNYNLIVSRSPVLELGAHLRYLVQYPFGCTEQIVSAAFPQLYYGDLADLVQLKNTSALAGGQTKLNANSNILEAIRKIKMRQLYTGAVTLWDGDGREDWWTTIYSAHFLLEAKKAGFDIETSLLETMLNYISNRLKNKTTISYYFNRNQNKKIAPKEIAYSLYVLALAGRNNVPAMNYYKAKPELLALDSRYLLSAAYATAGDRRSFTSLLPSSFSGEESVTQTGESYYSDVRDEAIALHALIETDPSNSQVTVMARHVSDKLKTRQWLSTQERAFAFLALGKLARATNMSTASAEIKVDGKTIAKVDDGHWSGEKAALKGTGIEISTNGNGRFYYFWQAEGISKTGTYTEEDSYLKVRKRFYDRFGNQVVGNTFRQNDLIIIAITLERSFSTKIENIVITDLLPAGFEIENPRTKDIPGMEWIKDAATPTALDVRDDRIHFFADANYNKQVYYYAVRAVTPGLFKIGPVSADAMYKGEYHSYHGAGIVKVQP